MLPNLLTTLRLVIIPFFAYSFLGAENMWLSMALFLFSGITDVVDGWIARRFNMITDVGKVYDPLVDKMMQMTVVICLAIKEIIPIWVICVVIIKEITMIIVSTHLYAKKLVVHSNWYGKFATVAFYAVILSMIAFPDMNYAIKTILLILLVGTLFFAALGYLIKIINPNQCDVYDKKMD